MYVVPLKTWEATINRRWHKNFTRSIDNVYVPDVAIDKVLKTSLNLGDVVIYSNIRGSFPAYNTWDWNEICIHKTKENIYSFEVHDQGGAAILEKFIKRVLPLSTKTPDVRDFQTDVRVYQIDNNEGVRFYRDRFLYFTSALSNQPMFMFNVGGSYIKPF
jgi:hypothetical protein